MSSRLVIDVASSSSASAGLRDVQNEVRKSKTLVSESEDLFPMLRLRPLGKGASAHVYKSIRLTDLQVCAEKVIAMGDAKLQAQVVSEVALLQSLSATSRLPQSSSGSVHDVDGEETDCPFVVKLFGSMTNPYDGKLSLLLEFVDLGSLQEVVQQGGCMDHEILRSLSAQLLEGLAFLHSHRLMHRDIKPSNILLSSDGVVKYSDFGIARAFEDNAQSMAQSFVGTFAFMAPERLAGQPYGYSTDVWGLAVTLLTVASGKHPMHWVGAGAAATAHESSNFWAVLSTAKELSNVLDSLSRQQPLNAEFIDFLSQCTTTECAQRPTAAALRKHSFMRNAKLRLTAHQLYILRRVTHTRDEPNPSNKNASALMHAIVKKWTLFMRAMFDIESHAVTDPLLQQLHGIEAIAITKENISRLAKDLQLDAQQLQSQFRSALKQTTAFMGDRLQYLRKSTRDNQKHASTRTTSAATQRRNAPRSVHDLEDARGLECKSAADQRTGVIAEPPPSQQVLRQSVASSVRSLRDSWKALSRTSFAPSIDEKEEVDYADEDFEQGEEEVMQQLSHVLATVEEEIDSRVSDDEYESDFES